MANRIDRAALIEAALTAEHRQSCGCDGTLHAEATWTDRKAMVAAGLDAVLPLIADEIKAQRKRSSSAARNGAYGAGLCDAEAIVRGVSR